MRSDTDRHDIRAIFAYLKGNKPMLYFYIAVIVKGSLDIGLTSYVCKYCFGSIEYISVLTLASALPLLILYIALPSLLKRFEKHALYELGVIGSIIMSAIPNARAAMSMLSGPKKAKAIRALIPPIIGGIPFFVFFS